MKRRRFMTHRRECSPIGLDIGATSVQMAQLETASEGCTVREMRAKEIPASAGEGRKEVVIQTIREMIKEASFSGRSAVSVMPGYQMDIIPVKLSLSAEGSIEEAILKEAGSRLSYAVENAVIDYLPVEDGESEHEQAGTVQALLLAARREDIDEHLAIMDGAKLKPLAIDIAACALARVMRSTAPVDETNRLIINVGHLHTTLSLLCKESVLLDRHILWGRENMLEGLMNRLKLSRDSADRLFSRTGLHLGRSKGNCTAEQGSEPSGKVSDAVYEIAAPQLEKLAAEIERIIQYFSSEMRGASIDTIYFTGVGSNVRDFDVYLEERTDITTMAFDPFDAFKPAGDIPPEEGHAPDSSFSVALGLAMRGFACREACTEEA